MKTPIRYGLIGCGGFGRFCLEQYRSLPGVECTAAADVDPKLARLTAEKFGIDASPSPDALLQRSDVDIVHLATPPFTHASLAMAAMAAGKHVLCEKPLALTLEDAQAMIDASRQRGLILAVNLMMRYNPLCQAVKSIIESGELGEPLHAHFVNDARDELLPPDHWFWEPSMSGGIFIEHGVHFFDLFEWWFGPGEVLAAQQTTRPGTSFVEHVNCTVKYGQTILANFYHGFHQASRRDQQEWMIVFENGTLRMREWVPTTLEIDFPGTDAGAAVLFQMFEKAELRTIERFTGEGRLFTSRHRRREADAHFRLTVPEQVPKWELYGHILRALMNDQIAAIQNPDHVRLVSEANGATSLAYAVRARELADPGGTGAANSC